MGVLWIPRHHRVWLNLLIGHLMVVILLLRLQTSYIDAARCLRAISYYSISYGWLHFSLTVVLRRFRAMKNFAKLLTRHLSEESHGKAITYLMMDRDPTIHHRGWKMNTKSGIGTPAYCSTTCWRILNFRISSTMRRFDNLMLMETADMKTLCRAIGLGIRP